MKICFINCWKSLKQENRDISLMHIGYIYFGEDDECFGHNINIVFLGFGINFII